MKKYFALLLACLLGLTPACGQGISSMLPGPGTAHSAGGGGYNGPGDYVTATAFWGIYAYSAATRGTNAIQACNAADANCVDIITNATTGLLAVSTTNVGAIPCNDTTNICTIKTWYDQTGNGHTMTQNTGANRATLLIACGLTAGIPCGSAAGSTRYNDAINTTQVQPYTAMWVGYRTASTSSDDYMFGAASGTWSGGYGGFAAANKAICKAGVDLNPTASDATWHTIQCVFNGASGNVKVDATDNTGSIGTNGLSATAIFWMWDGGNSMKGRVAGGAFIPSSPSGTNLTNIKNANQSILGY